MTPRESPVSRSRSAPGTTTQHKTMSERQNQSDLKETERYAKRKLREIARDLESAQGTATIPQLVEEIEAAGAELAYVKTQIEEVEG